MKNIKKTAKEQERALFERKKEIFETKFKGTKWDDLFWDLLYDGGEWEGDEEGIKNIKVELERLRKEFIEEFGHEPEEEYNV